MAVKMTALCHREERSDVAISFSQPACLVRDCFAALAIVTSRTGHDEWKVLLYVIASPWKGRGNLIRLSVSPLEIATRYALAMTQWLPFYW